MIDPLVVQKKIQRLQRGETPRVLDLFSGCGGISLGFKKAGFSIAAAVEFDQKAALAHAANFHGSNETHGRSRDITKISPEDLASELKLGPVDTSIDVVVGGPPCQAFSRVGRSKLREILDHPEAFIQDPRSRLYLEYLRYVEAFQPLALLMENVPDVLNYGGENIAEQTAAVLDELGYEARYTLLNTAFYGVPQMRERMFLIALHKSLGASVVFPQPTHWLELPPGYSHMRHSSLRSVRQNVLFPGRDSHYVDAPVATRELPAAVTAAEALGDLPVLKDHLQGQKLRTFGNLLPYRKAAEPGSYAEKMRTWAGFEGHEGVVDHAIRYLPRDWEIFRRMAPGDQYPEAKKHALAIFEEELERRRAAGETLAEGSAEYSALMDAIVPPYDASKFPNKWRKMEPDRPARTLMAHLSKDSYSHIHYDSDQARPISVREAARLQSFPDGFQFTPALGAAFRQIGNAVPPLMAEALARSIRACLPEAAPEEAGVPVASL